MFVVERGSDIRLLMQGVARCTNRTGCLFQSYRTDGRRESIFGDIAPQTVVFTWQAARDPSGSLFVANVMGDSVIARSDAGKPLMAFPLRSPTIRQFAARPPDTREDMNKTLQRMRREPYTQIRSMVASASEIYIQYERVNPLPGESSFALDVYDHGGRLLHRGIQTPGILRTSRTQAMYFVNVADSGFGTVQIRTCSPGRRS